jgi:hypothetical protein
MIRRNPTLIAMSDADVQDVRDHLQRKKEAQQKQQAQTSSSGSSSAPNVGSSISADAAGKPLVAAEEAKRKREAMSKDQRLGLR